MKKLILLALIATAFAACKSESEEVTPPPTVQGEVTDTSNQNDPMHVAADSLQNVHQ